MFTPVLAAVLRAKVSTFMKLVMRSQQLEDSVESILELNSALVDSEVRARAVLENVAEGIVTATEAGVIESVNPSALRQFGYDHEGEMIGQPFASVVGERTGHRKDGSTFPMELGMSRMQIDGSTYEQAQFEMLARLAGAAELHDDDTGRHTHRVGELSVDIAARLGLPASVLELIPLAAVLHDVGKIAIPDAILSKRGKLSATEFDLVKTHTTVGAEMLSGSTFDLVATAEEIALTHHEKWDGSGYPAGLSGDAIPITGRIVAVADVFDALTHVRPYKPAWSVADAEAELRSQAGKHFDPQVVDAFFSARSEPRPALAGALL